MRSPRRAERVDHRSLDEQHIETLAKAETARAANDNVQARVFDPEAARRDRDPEPKIGHAAVAPERSGEQTERGNLWRAVVARNLDRFGAWIALQRARLDALWERFERVAARPQEREREVDQDGLQSDKASPSRVTSEQRDGLLGRGRDPKPRERPSKDERQR